MLIACFSLERKSKKKNWKRYPGGGWADMAGLVDGCIALCNTQPFDNLMKMNMKSDASNGK